MTDVVQKLWGFCHTLRHDGIDYGDYIEQITYLLFLKMADERGVEVPRGCAWGDLRELSGTELTDAYADVLRTLGHTQGILGDIYAGALSRFNNPVNLKRLVSLIDETDWTSLGVDVKAAAYEGLLEKAAAEGKKGAGQFFTPRILIQSIVRCMRPDPRAHSQFTICDPAVGTGGFLVAAREWLNEETRGALPREVARRVRTKTYYGTDLVARPRRMALMNLYLHGVEPHITLGDAIYEPYNGETYDVVLTNPRSGRRGRTRRRTATTSRWRRRTSSSTSSSTSSRSSSPAGERRWCCRITASSPTRRGRSSPSSPRTASSTRCCGCRAGRSRPTAPA
jgi:type I restriction enzyme M protein